MTNALAKLYEKPLASNKVFPMKCLFNMKMSECGSIANHLNDFNMLTNKLSFVGVKFDDEVRALSILCSFPESSDGLVMAVSNYVFVSSTLKLMMSLVLCLAMKCSRKAQVRHQVML